jgi:hypothetical protein
MARRASSSSHPLWLIAAAALVLVVIGVGYLLYGKANDPYRTMKLLPVADYMENANSLRGNVYKLDGTVSRSLDWSATAGRLFSVDVSGTSTPGEVVPLLVPAEFNNLNIERGQRFLFKIEVGDKGILRVQDLRKA